MWISKPSEGPRPNFLMKGLEGLIQGAKALVSLGLAALMLVAGVFVLHLSDEPISGEAAAYKPNPVEPIYQLELSEQQQFLVLRARQQILFRDVESGELMESLPALPHIVSASKWIPSSQQLILGHGDGRVALLKRGESWKMKYTAHVHQEDIRSIALSSDGRLAATGSLDRLCLWDLEQGHLLASTTALDGGPDSMQFSPDQQRIVAGTDNGKIQIIQVKNLNVLRSFNLSPVAISEAAFFDDGQKVLAGDLHGKMFALDANTGEIVWTENCCRLHLIALAISPDQSYAALTDWTDNIHLYSLETFERIDRFVGHKSAVSTVQFSRDGKTLYSSSYDGTVRVWDIGSFSELDCYRGTIPDMSE